jgi:teichuronic acid biosynthesis glycosyltransferase TuaH
VPSEHRAGPHREVVLALAYHTWADGVARQMSWSPDRIGLHLAQDEEVEDLLVANPLRSRLAQLRPGTPDPARDFPASATRRLVQPRRLRRADSNDVPAMARTYRHLDRWLHDRSRGVGHRDPVLVTCHPVLAAVADPGRWADVVYYGWDDWLSYPRHAHVQDLVAWSFRRMAAAEVNVIGVTRAVVDRVGSPRGTVVPNGIRGEDHHDLPPVPDWFAGLRGPVALYAGALQERVDVEALTRLARELPDWQVVLVGPLTEPARFEEVGRLANVHVHGPEPRPRVLAMMERATVCLVPHRRTEMSEAMSPLKLYEYLASGARVVATDLEPMRGVSESCLLVEPGAPLAPAVLAAAALPPVPREEVARFRRDHDWATRYALWRRAALGL